MTPTIEEVAGWLREAQEEMNNLVIFSGNYPSENQVFHDRAAQVEAMGWRPIVEAPIGKDMFVAISTTNQYISDPWCVWQQRDGDYSRWPHKFKPTHFMPLPQPPVKK